MSDGRALLLDVGNTRLKWGIYQDGRIGRSGSVSHDDLRATSFAALTARLPRGIDRAICCNVAGASVGTRLAGVIGLQHGIQVRFVHPRKNAYGVVNGYRNPRKLGVDRWVALIAAHAQIRGAACIVDAGTAVTIDVLDRTGRHLGGQILPGIDLMASSLRTETAEIPARGRKARPAGEGLAMFAGTTDAAIANGALNAVCGAIERAMRQLRSLRLRPRLVLTGGDASRILPCLGGKGLHRPHLVLEGLAHILDCDS